MNGTVCTLHPASSTPERNFLEHIIEGGDIDTRSQMIRMVKACQLTGHGNCMTFTLSGLCVDSHGFSEEKQGQ